jgi:hypothetical protein
MGELIEMRAYRKQIVKKVGALSLILSRFQIFIEPIIFAEAMNILGRNLERTTIS